MWYTLSTKGILCCFISRCEFPNLNPSIFEGERSQKKNNFTPTTSFKLSCNGLGCTSLFKGFHYVFIMYFIMYF